MATPNYSYEKRQKELAKKRKKEDKLKQKSQRKTSDSEPGTDEAIGCGGAELGQPVVVGPALDLRERDVRCRLDPEKQRRVEDRLSDAFCVHRPL